jgi:hypothetical protein
MRNNNRRPFFGGTRCTEPHASDVRSLHATTATICLINYYFTNHCLAALLRASYAATLRHKKRLATCKEHLTLTIPAPTSHNGFQ